MKAKLLVLAAASMMMASAAVHAAPITQTLDISGSNFRLSFGSATPLPVDPLLIDVSVSLDNSANIGPTTSGLSVFSFNLPYAVQYAYDAASDVLTLATFPGASLCTNPASSFCIFVTGFSTATPNASFVQQSTASGGYWVAQTNTTNVGTVPEPGTLALLALGLAGLAASRRRKQ